MRTRQIYLSATLLVLLALTGCRSSRQAEAPAARIRRQQQSEMLIPLAQYPAGVETATAKTSISLNYNGIPATVKGRLRMRRDEVVQMSITAFGLMEIALVEFTPKGAYFIDKVNKQYARYDYSSGVMNLAGFNFNAIQALFWNRLFIPGEKDVWRKTTDFVLTDAGAQRLIEPKRQRMLKCQFYTDASYKQLQQTNLQLQQYGITWHYGKFETADSYTYPTTHEVSVSGNTHTLGAHIGLTGVSTVDTGWKSTTDLSRYREVELEQIMSILNMIQ